MFNSFEVFCYKGFRGCYVAGLVIAGGAADSALLVIKNQFVGGTSTSFLYSLAKVCVNFAVKIAGRSQSSAVKRFAKSLAVVIFWFCLWLVCRSLLWGLGLV